MKRKIFAAFLSVMMVISMLPTAAFAEEAEAPAQCKHEDAHWETVEEATCTEPGKQVLHCHDCETDLEEKEIPALGHDLQPTGEFAEPTCTEGAGEVYACSRCDYVETKAIDGAAAEPALGHDLVETVVPATCKEGGYTLVTCKRCDYSEKKNETPVDEDAHNFVLQEPALKEATCTTTGIGRYVCSVCGKSGGYKIIPAGHKWVEASREEATCGKDGKVTYECANCDETKEEVLPATGKHNFVEGKTIDATCTENAKVGQVCSVCGAAGETVEVPDSALGHKWISAGLQEADCTNAAGEKFVCENDPEHVKVVAFEGALAEPAKGHTPKAVPAVEANCSNTGLTEGSVCAVCGEVLVEQKETPVDETKHVPVQAAVLKEATCTTTGIARMECELCGKNLGYKVIADGHDFSVELDRVDATCGEDGKVTYKCSKCDKTKEEVLPATGEHDWKETYADATCTSNAKAGYVCTVCGAEKEVTEIPGTMLEHDMKVDEKNSKPATCEEDGIEVKKCANCDHTETKTVPALGHDWVSAGMQEADCTNAAGEKFVCANDAAHTKVVAFEGELAQPAKGHTPETVPAVDATCSKPGLTEGIKCSVCGEILVKQEETPVDETKHVPTEAAVLKEATCTTTGIARMECADCHKNLGYQVLKAEHVYDELVSRVEPTCGKAGSETYRCSKCADETAVKVVELPATGKHDFEEKYVEATCTENAKAGHVCAVCGLEDEDYGEVEGTVLGHDMVLDTKNEKYKPVTCEEDGLDTFKCSRCGETEEKVVKATGKHTWNKGENVDADCTHASGAKYTCTKCGATKFEEYPAEIGQPALGHKPEVIPAVAATCKSTGLTEGSKCSVCGEILVKQEETPVDENAHVEGVAATLKEATCTTTGIARYTCTLCGKNLGYKVLKAEHKWEELNVVPATCGKDGKAEYFCSVCGETDEEILPATGEHTFDEKNVKTVDATCTEDAKVIEVCTVCGAEGKTTVLEGTALGHELVLDETNKNYKPATCEEDGLATLKCSRCDYTEEQPIKAEGSHKWDKGVNVPATCTEDEHLLFTCTVCKATKTEAYPEGIGQKALGHDLKKTVTPATCAKEGYTTVTCSRCDYNEITDKTPVDANNHTWNVTHLKEATCTATGIDRRVCADCGKSEYVVAEKLAHTYDPKNAKMTKEPTCAEAGEVSNTCTVCGKVSVVDTIPNDGIEHVAVEIPETDTMKAGFKCKVCGKILVEPVEKCEHKNTETLEAKAATCTATGLTEGKKCVDCGKILVAQEEVPMTEHTAETVAAVPATCTAAGLTEGSRCSVCGKVLVEQEEVPMVEHTAEVVAAKAATCTEDGLTEGSRCSVCGTVLTAQETVKALGHEEVVLEPVAPTCEGTGLTAGVKCGRCGEVLKAQEEIAAKGHTEVSFEGKEATCTEAGHTAGTKCADCGKILSGNEEIPALDHDFEFVDDTEEGVLYRCTRCGVEKVEN